MSTFYLPYRLDFSDNKIPFVFDETDGGDRVAVTFATRESAQDFLHDAWDSGDRDYTSGIIAVTRDSDGWFVDSDGRLVCHETGEEPCGYDLVDDIREAEWAVNGEPA